MSKLINVWNGLAVFLGAMGGIFILLDHVALGIVFLVISGILALIPAVSEIKELGKYRVIIIAGVAISSFGILAYILFTPKSQPSTQPDSLQKQRMQDDSLRKLQTEKHFQSKTRPYLTLIGIRLVRAVGKQMYITMVLENTGETAAMEVRAILQSCIDTTPNQREFILSRRYELTSASVFPKEQKIIQSVHKYVLTTELNDSISRKIVYVYAYGRILYGNEIDKKTVYSREICAIYDPLDDSFHDIKPYRFSYEKEAQIGKQTNQ